MVFKYDIDHTPNRNQGEIPLSEQFTEICRRFNIMVKNMAPNAKLTSQMQQIGRGKETNGLKLRLHKINSELIRFATIFSMHLTCLTCVKQKNLGRRSFLNAR